MPRTYTPKKKLRRTQAIKPLTPAENAVLYLFQIGMLALVLMVFFLTLATVEAQR